jgi:hypothetical protein
MVLEIVAAETARQITEAVTVPTIGIGSGQSCDGEILVTHDLIGMFPWFVPKFVKPEADVSAEIRKATAAFIERTTAQSRLTAKFDTIGRVPVFERVSMRATPRTRDFDDDAVWTGSKQRNWLAVGLLVSLLLHAALCGYFYKTRFDLADSALKMPEPTATFKVKNVDLSALEKASQDQTTQAAKPEPDKTDVQLPDEKKSFDKLLEEVHASTAMPDDTSDVLPDKPRVDQSNASSIMNEIERSTAQVLSNSPNATREQSLLNDSASSVVPSRRSPARSSRRARRSSART